MYMKCWSEVNLENMGNTYESFKQKLRDYGFDIDIESYDNLKTIVSQYAKNNDFDGLLEFLNQLQNCGGYALQLPIKIYNAFNYSFEERVLRILELYPFVRLLGDTQLKEEEYIVLYRAEDTGFGHHFVKIYNNKASQKNSDGVPMNFTEWGKDWENEQEAVFAVLKQEFRTREDKELPQCNYDLFLDDELLYLTDENNEVELYRGECAKPKSFSDRIEETINCQKNTFIYRDKSYVFKIESDNPRLIYIFDENGSLIGQFDIADINHTIKADLNTIYGFQPKKTIIIERRKRKIRFIC